MVTMNISLPEPMKDFVEARARSGSYANVSDYVRDLIRRDQERKQAIAEIQALIEEGIASGPPEPFDMQEFLASKRAK
jgi:antitoxin ParD1/3/4